MAKFKLEKVVYYQVEVEANDIEEAYQLANGYNFTQEDEVHEDFEAFEL